MTRSGLIFGALLLVSACATSAELPLVSGDDLAPAEASFAPATAESPQSAAAQLASVEVDTSAVEPPRRGLFGRLFGKKQQDEVADAVQENAPESPQDNGAEPTETEQQNADTPDQVDTEQASETPRRGLFGLFKKRDKPVEETSGVAVAAAIENTNPPAGLTSEGGDIISAEEEANMGKPEAPRRGLFGFLGKRDKPSQDEDAAAVEVASIDPDTITDAEPEPARRGLFGGRKGGKGDQEIPLGTVLPYGQVGVACNVRGRKLGTEIDQFNQKGSSFKLYDTKPGSTEFRTHYLTGFKDGCARQFTGALVMIGSPVLHERMRFDSYNKHLAYTETDRAYDKIRKRVCKTSGKVLCPQERVDALESETAFVTIYKQFGANLNWAEILLNKGKFIAISTR